MITCYFIGRNLILRGDFNETGDAGSRFLQNISDHQRDYQIITEKTTITNFKSRTNRCLITCRQANFEHELHWVPMWPYGSSILKKVCRSCLTSNVLKNTLITVADSSSKKDSKYQSIIIILNRQIHLANSKRIYEYETEMTCKIMTSFMFK
jgi:hypothetical protein